MLYLCFIERHNVFLIKYANMIHDCIKIICLMYPVVLHNMLLMLFS